MIHILAIGSIPKTSLPPPLHVNNSIFRLTRTSLVGKGLRSLSPNDLEVSSSNLPVSLIPKIFDVSRVQALSYGIQQVTVKRSLLRVMEDGLQFMIFHLCSGIEIASKQLESIVVV